jgi:hypothetical protein
MMYLRQQIRNKGLATLFKTPYSTLWDGNYLATFVIHIVTVILPLHPDPFSWKPKTRRFSDLTTIAERLYKNSF